MLPACPARIEKRLLALLAPLTAVAGLAALLYSALNAPPVTTHWPKVTTTPSRGR